MFLNDRNQHLDRPCCCWPSVQRLVFIIFVFFILPSLIGSSKADNETHTNNTRTDTYNTTLFATFRDADAMLSRDEIAREVGTVWLPVTAFAAVAVVVVAAVVRGRSRSRELAAPLLG